MATAAEEPPAAGAPPAPPAMMIDPCDPKRMIFDSVDLLAYEIIANPSKRAERKGQLEVGFLLVWFGLHSCTVCVPVSSMRLGQGEFICLTYLNVGAFH